MSWQSRSDRQIPALVPINSADKAKRRFRRKRVTTKPIRTRRASATPGTWSRATATCRQSARSVQVSKARYHPVLLNNGQIHNWQRPEEPRLQAWLLLPFHRCRNPTRRTCALVHRSQPRPHSPERLLLRCRLGSIFAGGLARELATALEQASGSAWHATSHAMMRWASMVHIAYWPVHCRTVSKRTGCALRTSR